MDPLTIAKIIMGLKAAKGGVSKGGNPFALGGVVKTARAGLAPPATTTPQTGLKIPTLGREQRPIAQQAMQPRGLAGQADYSLGASLPDYSDYEYF